MSTGADDLMLRSQNELEGSHDEALELEEKP